MRELVSNWAGLGLAADMVVGGVAPERPAYAPAPTVEACTDTHPDVELYRAAFTIALKGAHMGKPFDGEQADTYLEEAASSMAMAVSKGDRPEISITAYEPYATLLGAEFDAQDPASIALNDVNRALDVKLEAKAVTPEDYSGSLGSEFPDGPGHLKSQTYANEQFAAEVTPDQGLLSMKVEGHSCAISDDMMPLDPR